MMVNERRMITGLMTPRHVPLRERYIAGWDKLQSIKEFMWIKVIKWHKIVEVKRDRRTGEVSWVDDWILTLEWKTNDPEWTSYGNEREASKDSGQS